MALKENTLKYSEMISKMYDYFEDQLPESLTIEDVFECCIEAWNLAVRKVIYGDDLYNIEVKDVKFLDVIEKMVEFKNKHFFDYNNFIINYSIENDILSVESQLVEDRFNYFLSKMINNKPEIKSKKKK